MAVETKQEAARFSARDLRYIQPDLHRLAVPIEWLRPHPRNPRVSDVDAIKESIREHKQAAPVTLWKGTTNGQRGIFVVKGNHVFQAMFELESPAIAAVWFRGSARQALKYLLADNRSSDTSTYDQGILASLLADMEEDLGGTLWSLEDVDRLLREHERQLRGEEEDPDRLPSPPAVTVSRPGDLWHLGPHRLLVGDALRGEQVAELVNGSKVAFVFTDPPYGVGYDGGSKKQRELEGDRAGFAAFYRAILEWAERFGDPSCAVMAWCADRRVAEVAELVKRPWELRNMLVWVKDQAQFGAFSAQYKVGHEPLLYICRKQPKWRGPSNETTVWEAPRARVNDLHPTQKPVELAERAILNHTDKGEVVLDLFAGSGSTLIGADLTGRRCFAMEIEPQFADVICKRWELHSGELPEREGELVSFVDSEDPDA